MLSQIIRSKLLIGILALSFWICVLPLNEAQAWTSQSSKVSVLSGPEVASGDGQNVSDVSHSPSGSRYVAGIFQGTIDIDPSPAVYSLSSIGRYSAYIGKYDNFGELLWGKVVCGNTGGNTNTGLRIEIDNLENIYISGEFSGTVDCDPGSNVYNLTSIGGDDRFLVKLDVNGNFIWAFRQGNEFNDHTAYVSTDVFGNVYLAGTFLGSLDFDPGAGVKILDIPSANGENDPDTFLLKLNSEGVFQWVISAFSSWGWLDSATGVDVDSNGNIYVSGYYQQVGCGLTACGTQKGFVRKFSQNSDLIWNLYIQNNTAEDQIPYGLTVSAQNSLLVYGKFQGTVNFNPSGTGGTIAATGSDGFALNISLDGNFRWVKLFNFNSAGGNINGADLDFEGSAYLVGSFSTSLISYSLASSDTDAFIVKLDSSGNSVYAKQLVGASYSTATSVASLQFGDVLIGGTFSGTTDFDSSSQKTVSLTPQGTSDVFIWQLDSIGNSGLDPAISAQFSNPVSTKDGFTLSILNYDAIWNFALSTNLGMISQEKPEGNVLRANVTGLNPGTSAIVTVSTSRYNYATTQTLLTGTSELGAALNPTFSTPVATATGFTVNVTNFDPAYTFTPAITAGTGSVSAGTASGSTLPLTVTGLAPGASATVTVTVTRTGYVTGSQLVSGSALLAALNPTFSTPVRTATGFTVNVTNFDPAYTFTPAITAGTGSVSAGTASGSTLPLTVTGLAPGASATVTVTVTRTGYATGSGLVSSTALFAALNPTFSTPVRTSTGFTVNVNNYNSLYTYTPTITSGSGVVSRGTASGSTLPLTVTGLAPGASATVTVTVTRTGYVTGSGSVIGTAQTGAALNPTFSTPVATATGFTVNVTNYNSLYTFTPAISAGTGIVSSGTPSGSTLPLTVTGLAPGASATVTVTVTRTGYNDGVGRITSAAQLGSALNPNFSSTASTVDGFNFEVTNYDANFTFTFSVSNGIVTRGIVVDSTLPLTVTGLAPGASATVTVTVTRTGYVTGSGSVIGTAQTGAALNPTFSTPVATATGFTVNVTNFDPAYTFTPAITVGTGSVSAGTASGSTLPLTVTGLAPGASATVTVTVTRTGYVTGSGSVIGTAQTGAALNPTFSTPVRTATGFTVNVTNFDPAYTFTPAITAGTGSVSAGTASGSTLPLTVTGLAPGASATVTVTVTRTGYVTGSGSVIGTAQTGAALNPTFSTPVATATGFTVNVTNFDPAYTFTPSITAGTGSVSAGTASGSTLPLTVTGLAPGASATVTVTVTRTGYVTGSGSVIGTAQTGAALNPTFSTPVATATGFTVNVTNFDPAYTFTPAITAGTGSVSAGTASGSTLPLTVTGLALGASATVTVTVTRTGYATGSGLVSSTALFAALNPTFSTPVRTSTGFTVNVNNYNSLYTYTPTITSGSGVVSRGTASGSTLPLTVTGLAPGASATVTVTVTRTGYVTGSGSVIGTAQTGAALNPTFSTPVATATGFTVNVTNFDPAYTFTPAVIAGTGTATIGIPAGSNLPVTVTGVTTGSATISISTSRVGYASGSGRVAANALPTISSISSSNATTGIAVTITGTNLWAASRVSVGTSKTASTKFSVISPSTIIFNTAAAATGAVTVVTPGGTATGPSISISSTRTAPGTITMSTNTGGPGTSVVLTGDYLGATTSVVRAKVSIPFRVIAINQIILAIPSGLATGAFTVTTPGGSANSTTFTASSVLVVPTITSGTQSITRSMLATFTGNNLGAIVSMSINGQAFTDYTVTSAGSITVRVPATATIGQSVVVITTAGGNVASNSLTII